LRSYLNMKGSNLLRVISLTSNQLRAAYVYVDSEVVNSTDLSTDKKIHVPYYWLTYLWQTQKAKTYRAGDATISLAVTETEFDWKTHKR